MTPPLFPVEDILRDKKSILAVVAHPDDFEDYFSGTFISAIKKGIIKPDTVHLLVCTDGCNGGRSSYTDPELLKKIRQLEQCKSLEMLNIPSSHCHFLDFRDGYLHNTDNVLTERISYYIRKLKPDLILTHNGFEAIIDKPNGTYYTHKDHRTVGQAAMDAVYPYSRDLLFFPHHHLEGLTGHKTLEVLLSETQHPNVKVDVTDVMKKKIKLIRNFNSQIESDDWLYQYFKDTTGEGKRYIESFKYVKLII